MLTLRPVNTLVHLWHKCSALRRVLHFTIFWDQLILYWKESGLFFKIFVGFPSLREIEYWSVLPDYCYSMLCFEELLPLCN